MNLHLNYHHLRYFLAVAEEGGVRQASDSLRISPPTLSAQVRALEGFLDRPLFLRTGKSLIPTDAGRVVKRYAERIFALGDEMVEVIQRGEPGGPEGVFVGIVDSVPKLFAAQILSRALAERPELRITVREGLSGELFPALASHQLDIVIATEAAPASLKTVLFSKKAGRFSVCLVAAPALRTRFRRRNGLHKFPLLVPTRESALRRELERWWAEEGIRPDIRAEFDDSAAMCELAAAGVGAAPMLAPVLDDIAKRYGLVELPVRTGLHEDLYVVTAERQFTHEGQGLVARLAGEFAGSRKCQTVAGLGRPNAFSNRRKPLPQ